MDAGYLIEMTYRMLLIVLLLSLPVVAASVISGIVVGILQAVTQVQDQSIAYGVKLVAGIAVIALSMQWAGGELLLYARQVFENVANMR